MAPTPQDIIVGSPRNSDLDNLTGNEIVISGISGLFPKSDNVVQFMENLYNHVDMVGPISPQMSLKHPDVPKFLGQVNGYNKFDNQFFKVPYRQTEYMEPYNRKLLEETYSAIFDAGINPVTIHGARIGVFIGFSFSDQTSINLYDVSYRSTYMVTGCSKTMLANRISYWIDGKAASYALDESTASSTVCLEHAYWAIRNGLCDAAIVGGCNQCVKPMLSINLRRAGLVTLDGKTKCFDKNGDGYVRSEVCGTLFLQKAKDAKRIYCEVYYAKEKFFISPNDSGISVVHKPQDLEEFFREFYNDIDVSPDSVDYIEANAIGISEADANELKAIANFFTKNKNLKVGSVNSNMGHGEAGSGISSVIKMCLANHTGKLPANLHYSEPFDDIPALKEGRLQVVTDNLPFNRGYVALNSFSYGGVNVHVLLKGFYKKKDHSKYRSSIPHLALASARTESGVNKIINYLKNKPIDPEEIALLHNFYSIDISGHTARGYVVLNTDNNNKTIASSESVNIHNGVKRPVWFLYSGMGSQWESMAATLMKIPVFAAAIERCRRVLEPKGVDIVRILTEPDKTIFDNILNSFVGIGTVQIGLTDVLKELDIIPDNIIGHSVGELGCAYADGCFTTEEMILASYYRGLVSYEAELTKGAMAAVGLGYKNILPICPPEIDIACHNSSESCTISGPYDDIKKFVADLKSRGVFAREVNTANKAYHSRYIAPLGDKLRSKMKEFIPTPKLRSKKWLATSVLPENWDTPEARYSSAEYFTNNLLSSVYFEEVATRIPPDAIVIEIAPHGLMQAILKRSHESCVHVPLTRRQHHDGSTFLLDAIGKLYEAGLNPKIEALYPKVEFPVSTETPILSHLVEWEHSEEWLLVDSKDTDTTVSPSNEVILSIHDEEWCFIKDHVRDGIVVVPEAVILVLVWETVGTYQGIDYKNLSVSFNDVEFHGVINIVDEDAIKINVTIMKGSEKFEVSCRDMIIASGYVRLYNTKYLYNYVTIPVIEESDGQLNSNDVYTIMNSRGCSYGSKMRSIDSCNFKRNKAQIKCNGEWAMIIDSLLQLGALATDYTDVMIPAYINKLFIDTHRHMNLDNDGKHEAIVIGNDEKIIRCGAVEIKNIIYRRKPITESEGSRIVPQNLLLKNINDSDHEYKENNNQDIKLSTIGCGDFDKLVWTAIEKIKCNAAVQVSYAGISVVDCYKIMGSLSECDTFGMDYSGVNNRNERVMGVVSSGAMATSVEADVDLMWPVPEHWSLEDAATVPLPYLLAYYALAIRSQIQKHHSILIMNGDTPLGQAFISICLDLGCIVFTTVSNMENKKILLKLFSNLKDEHTIDYSTTNVNSVIAAYSTKSACDFIANCGYGVPLEVEIGCLGYLGILLHFIDNPECTNFGMDYLNLDRNLCLVHLANLFKPNQINEKKMLQTVISEGIARGVVKPIHRVVHFPADVSNAFQVFAADGFTGRVLIDMKTLQKHHIALPRITTYAEGTQTVISDASGLGIEIVDKLVNRGAKNVVLHCAKQSGYLRYKLQLWKKSGASVTVYSDNLHSEKNCTKLIENSLSMGSVGGIFIVETMTQNCKYFAEMNKHKLKQSDEESIVDNIDKVSSELCPELRSFVIIALTSSEDKDGRILFERQKTCQLRRQRGFPSIVFQIELSKQQTENIEDLLINTRSTMLSSIFISLESAIKFGTDFIFTMNNEKPTVDFKQKITKILGIKDAYEFDEHKTLKDLGIKNLILKEIRALINTVFGVNCPLDQLQETTIHSLMTFGESDVVEVKTGLNAFFSYVDADECRVTDSIVIMSAINKHKREVEIDSTGTYLLMVPGFEGHHEVFTLLSSAFKIPAVTLQTGFENQEDIPKMARRIMRNIKKTFKLKTKFHLLGYSFGVNVALELASLIEKEGHTGIVYCLDSSPDALKVQMDEYIGKLDEEDLQNAIIKHMYCVFSGRDGDNIESEIKDIHNWDAKVEFCVKRLKSLINHSHGYIKCTIQGFYDKIIASRDYKPNFLLRSELVLLKGLQRHNKTLEEDYGLKKYTAQPVRVINIQNDFSSIIHNYRVASVVNKFLEPHLLK